MTHLIDTSALLAFIFGEPGAEQVQALIEDERNHLSVSVLTKVEFWSRLKSLGREEEWEREWALHISLFEAILDVSQAVADRSIALRRACPDRLPTADALIAATAVAHNLILVHRDTHFGSIPERWLRQVDLAVA